METAWDFVKDKGKYLITVSNWKTIALNSAPRLSESSLPSSIWPAQAGPVFRIVRTSSRRNLCRALLCTSVQSKALQAWLCPVTQPITFCPGSTKHKLASTWPCVRSRRNQSQTRVRKSLRKQAAVSGNSRVLEHPFSLEYMGFRVNWSVGLHALCMGKGLCLLSPHAHWVQLTVMSYKKYKVNLQSPSWRRKLSSEPWSQKWY